MVELIEANRHLLLILDINLENKLLSRFGDNRDRERQVVLFIESYDYMLEVGEDVLLSDDHFSSSSGRVVFEVEVNVWTYYLVVFAKNGFEIKDLPVG